MKLSIVIPVRNEEIVIKNIRNGKRNSRPKGDDIYMFLSLAEGARFIQEIFAAQRAAFSEKYSKL